MSKRREKRKERDMKTEREMILVSYFKFINSYFLFNILNL